MVTRKEFLTMLAGTVFLPFVRHVPYRGLWIVGDSILGGQLNSESYNARNIIRNVLPEWTQIGSIDGRHDCHPGFRTDQIARDISSWALGIPEPELVWIYVGVNDVLQHSEFQLDKIINVINLNFPQADILLSRIAVIPDYKEGCLEFNKYVDSFKFSKIDYENAFIFEEHYLEDRIHLNDLGQIILAEKFIEFNGLTKL